MKRKPDKFILLIIILVLLLVSMTIYAVNRETDKLSKLEPPVIYVGKDEEILKNFSKEGAVAAMSDVLKSIDEDVEGKNRTLEERVEFMDKEGADLEDTISTKTIDKLYLADEFSKDEFNRQFTASALLTLRKLTEDVNAESLSDSLDELVYLDGKMMVAHIPADVFTGSNRGIAFEMVYIDGEWKFNPYTSMMSLVMIINYEEMIQSISKSDE